jgi:hypothetical protein
MASEFRLKARPPKMVMRLPGTQLAIASFVISIVSVRGSIGGRLFSISWQPALTHQTLLVGKARRSVRSFEDLGILNHRRAGDETHGCRQERLSDVLNVAELGQSVRPWADEH